MLNLVVSPVQALVVGKLCSRLLLAFDPHDMAAVAKIAACVTFGPGWLALLVWSLRAGDPDPRLLQAFKQTKTYDTIAALPLILWFAYGALQLRAALCP